MAIFTYLHPEATLDATSVCPGLVFLQSLAAHKLSTANACCCASECSNLSAAELAPKLETTPKIWLWYFRICVYLHN